MTDRIFSLRGLLRLVLTLLHLGTVFSGLVIMGWMMNGFDAPTIVYVGTLAVSGYLIWAGSGGIALASVWVVALMSMTALGQLWLHDLPRPRFIYIPMMALADWLLALVIVWRLGKLSDYFRQTKHFRIAGGIGLVGLVLVGLWLGWRIYPETLQYLTAYIS